MLLAFLNSLLEGERNIVDLKFLDKEQLGISDVKLGVDIVKVTTEKIIIDPTGIESIKANGQDRKATHYYNLLGQKVSPTTKGLIIHNGKKTIVK